MSLATVGAVIGAKSLGSLFTDGFQRGIQVEIITGIVATVLLALVLDGAVVLLGRALMPWTRRTRRIRPESVATLGRMTAVRGAA